MKVGKIHATLSNDLTNDSNLCRSFFGNRLFPGAHHNWRLIPLEKHRFSGQDSLHQKLEKQSNFCLKPSDNQTWLAGKSISMSMSISVCMYMCIYRDNHRTGGFSIAMADYRDG